MNAEAMRIAVEAPEARECLTDRQREIVAAFLCVGSVKGAARDLGVSPQAVRNALGYAGKKLERFAQAISKEDP